MQELFQMFQINLITQIRFVYLDAKIKRKYKKLARFSNYIKEKEFLYKMSVPKRERTKNKNKIKSSKMKLILAIIVLCTVFIACGEVYELNKFLKVKLLIKIFYLRHHQFLILIFLKTVIGIF